MQKTSENIQGAMPSYIVNKVGFVQEWVATLSITSVEAHKKPHGCSSAIMVTLNYTGNVSF